jgi:hypothetical protein
LEKKLGKKSAAQKQKKRISGRFAFDFDGFEGLMGEEK